MEKKRLIPTDTQEGIHTVRFTNLHEDEHPDYNAIKQVIPLRVGLQLLGLWQPARIPKVVGWIHYLLFLSLTVWFTIWKINYITEKFNAAVGILRGFDSLMFLLLWIFVPYALYKRGRPFINGIQYINDKRKKKISIIYGFIYIVLLIPQLAYAFLVNFPLIKDRIVPSLPWAKANNNNIAILDTILLVFGMVVGLLCVNTTLLFLAVAAHLQSFQINDFLENNLMSRGPIRTGHIKQILHLTIQSLRDGNESLEMINGTLVIGLLIAIIELGGKLLVQNLWDMSTFVPLLLLLFQIYFFLFPAAYISYCWDNVFHRCLELHALALNPEDELGPIVLYMTNVYAGYHVTNIRVDTNKIFYFTYILIGLLAIKAQSDVDFWIFW